MRAPMVAAVVAVVLVVGGCSPERAGRPPATQPRAPTSGPATGQAPPPGSAPQVAPTRRTPQARQAVAVWVASEDGRSASRIDAARGVVTLTVGLPGRPHNLAALPRGGAVASLPGQGQIVLVDARGRRTPARLGGSPHDVELAGQTLVVTNETAARLDLLTLDGRRQGTIGLRAQPHDLAVAPDRRTVWVSLDDSDRIAIVDVGARRVLHYLPTGRRPHDLLADPTGRIWVTDWGGSLAVYAPSGRLIRAVPLGDQAHHLARAPDGSEVWVTDSPGRLAFAIDARALRVTARLRLPGAPHHLGVAAGRVAVADHTNGTVVLFDLRSRRRVATVRVGAGPHGLAAVAS
jgi:DNA-binding beta-propeller fold protein YncE